MPVPSASDVIAACATPAGLGGVAVIRVSGEGTYALIDRLVALRVPPSERSAGTFVHARLVDGEGATLDDALVLFFRAPHSYTGEDTVELQVHGGAVVPQRVLERLWELGARPAEPGEFTKRAFLNGRLDLTQAEAVQELIAARTPRAERAARANLQGRLGNALGAFYENSLALSVQVEHLLDFDEGELPESFAEETQSRLRDLAQQAEMLLATWHEGRLLREGALVVIAGKPNAGKSSLLNLLLGYRRAIVSDTPGTTRDSIEETLVLDGVPIRLVDTAGLRETDEAIEHEGVDRAKALVGQADLVLWLTPADSEETPPEGVVALRSKVDLAAQSMEGISVTQAPEEARAKVCALLREHLGLHAEETPGAKLANERQFAELTQAKEALREAVEAFALGERGLVPAAQRLRAATEALGRILGRVYTDDLLDRVFATFCVGK